LIGADIYLNVVELQTNKDLVTQDGKLFKPMIRFFVNEVQLGTEIHGCISKKQLLSTNKIKREKLETTSPVSVQAAPGFSYMLIEVVTSGNLLMHHLLVVRTRDNEESKTQDDRNVF
jgi:hypothetical protein